MRECLILLFFFLKVTQLHSRSLFSFKYNLAPFLPAKYPDLRTNKEYLIRQVPGDGSCLFDALSVCYQYQNTSKHQPYDYSTKLLSKSLRKSAVEILSSNRTLSINSQESIPSLDLLEQTAKEYNITPSLYCQMMLDTSTWGGGPEILAISALLDYPINIYQLCCKSCDPNRLYISKLCTLGSSIHHSNQSLSILYADGRFPHLTPADVKQSHPDHFLALFDADTLDSAHNWTESSTSFRHRYFSRASGWRRRKFLI